MFGYRNESLSGEDFNYNTLVNFSTWPKSINYTINIYASDSHTDKYWPQQKVAEKNSNIQIKFNKGGFVNIWSQDASIAKTTKTEDRYKFKFKFADKQKDVTRIFYIKTDLKLKYLKDSKYKGHFILGDGVRWGYWLDWKTKIDATPIIEKITDKKYKITFLAINDGVEFQSIGGLNIKHISSYLYIPDIPNISSIKFYQLPAITDEYLYSNVTGTQAGGGLAFEYKWFKNLTLFKIQPGDKLSTPNAYFCDGVSNCAYAFDDSTSTNAGSSGTSGYIYLNYSTSNITFKAKFYYLFSDTYFTLAPKVEYMDNSNSSWIDLYNGSQENNITLPFNAFNKNNLIQMRVLVRNNLIGDNFGLSESYMTVYNNSPNNDTSFYLDRLSPNDFGVGDNITLSVRAYDNAFNIYSGWVNSTTMINDIDISQCTSGNLTKNFYFYTPTFARSIEEYSLNLYYGYTSGGPYNHNISFNGSANNFSLCLYPDWATIYGDIFVQYGNYSYSISNMNFTNTTEDINLYVEPTTTAVLFSVIGYDTAPIPNSYIYVQLWDAANNSYLTTQVLKTDSNGEAVGYLTLLTEWYKFIVMYDGQIKLVDPESQGVRVYTTTRVFRISTDETAFLDNFDYVNGIIGDVSFNNGTDTFTFTWLNPELKSILACMKIEKSNSSGKYLTNNSCATSSSGTLVYQITPQNNSAFTANGYINYNGDNFLLDSFQKVYGGGYSLANLKGGSKEPLFMALIVLVVLIMVGIPAPEISFLLFIVGLVVSVALGMFTISFAAVGGVVVLGAIHLFIGNRK